MVLNLSYVPIVNPEIVTGVATMLLFVVLNGTISDVLTALLGNEVRVSFGIGTLLIAHVTFCLPYVLFNVSPKLRQMDVRMYEAALDLGCNPRQAFSRWCCRDYAAIISAFLISLTYSIDDFIISYFNSGTVQTLPIAIYSMTKKRVSPEINALSTIMFVVILTIILAVNGVEAARDKRTARAARRRRAYEQAPLCQKAAALRLRRVPGRAVHARLAEVEVEPGYDIRAFADDNITPERVQLGRVYSDGADGTMDVVQEFEELTGINVNYTTYDTNESLYAKLKSGGDYDIIIPSDYMIGQMINEGMLEKLDFFQHPQLCPD